MSVCLTVSLSLVYGLNAVVVLPSSVVLLFVACYRFIYIYHIHTYIVHTYIHAYQLVSFQLTDRQDVPLLALC